MPIIPVAEFAPDLPDAPSATSDAIFNVIPVSSDAYGPMQSHQPLSTALNARCQGGIAASDNAGVVRVYAGTNNKLFRLASPGVTPADVSRVAGYSTSAVLPWSFTVHSQRIIATNFNDVPQGYLEGTSTIFSNLITSGTTTLKAKYAAMIKNWLFFANTSDTASGAQPQRTWWSAIDDPTNFPTPGTQTAANNLSDYQDIPGPHGQIMGIAGNLGSADGAVFFERAVWRIVYSGLPAIFSFLPVEGLRGLLVSGGLCQLGSKVAFPTEDGFYMFDGSQAVPIGKAKIDKFFRDDIISEYQDRMCCTADPARGLMIWAYAGAGSNNGALNRLLIYSEAFNKWTVTEAGSVQINFLLRGATFGATLEALDSFGTIDSLAFSLDSNAWSGNRSILAAFDSSNRYGYFDGANLAATIDTMDFEVEAGHQTKIHRARPLLDASGATLSGCSRDTITASLTYSPAQVQETNGSCPMRMRGRYHRVRAQIPAGLAWSKFSGIDLEEAAIVGGRGKR